MCVGARACVDRMGRLDLLIAPNANRCVQYICICIYVTFIQYQLMEYNNNFILGHMHRRPQAYLRSPQRRGGGCGSTPAPVWHPASGGEPRAGIRGLGVLQAKGHYSPTWGVSKFWSKAWRRPRTHRGSSSEAKNGG